jgi:hypothetical protein
MKKVSKGGGISDAVPVRVLGAYRLCCRPFLGGECRTSAALSSAAVDLAARKAVEPFMASNHVRMDR